MPSALNLCPAVAGCGGSELLRGHSPLAPPRTARAAAAVPRWGSGGLAAAPAESPALPARSEPRGHRASRGGSGARIGGSAFQRFPHSRLFNPSSSLPSSVINRFSVRGWGPRVPAAWSLLASPHPSSPQSKGCRQHGRSSLPQHLREEKVLLPRVCCFSGSLFSFRAHQRER